MKFIWITTNCSWIDRQIMCLFNCPVGNRMYMKLCLGVYVVICSGKGAWVASFSKLSQSHQFVNLVECLSVHPYIHSLVGWLVASFDRTTLDRLVSWRQNASAAAAAAALMYTLFTIIAFYNLKKKAKWNETKWNADCDKCRLSICVLCVNQNGNEEKKSHARFAHL